MQVGGADDVIRHFDKADSLITRLYPLIPSFILHLSLLQHIFTEFSP